MEIKWYTTASISLKVNNTKIIFDPFIPMPGSKIPVKVEDYIDYDYIIITHGHFDHIGSLKKIYKKNNKIKIYCTNTPYNYLYKHGIPKDNLVQITNDSIIKINDFEIKTYQSKHVVFDKGTIRRIIFNLRTYKYLYNAPKIIYGYNTCKENDEILFFDVFAENKHIHIIGSLGYDNETTYPTNADLLVLPYQGKNDLLTPSLEIIDILKPKCIMLDHFDNSFPPASKTILTDDIENALDGKIKVIKPKCKETIII